MTDISRLDELIDKISKIKEISFIDGYPDYPEEINELLNACGGGLDCDYLKHIEAIQAKEINKLNENEIITYMTFILRGERFSTGHIATYIEDGRLVALGKRFLEIQEENNATSYKLVEVAKERALIPFHGNIDGKESNIAPLISCFPRWNIDSADGAWCAAFVYHCCIEAGYKIPYSPKECVSCSLAGCGGWEEFAKGDNRIGYFKMTKDFLPKPGDIVLFDREFNGQEHDHIGIILKVTDTQIITAEGNVDNRSQIVTRNLDEHIRAFIRIPDGFKY